MELAFLLLAALGQTEPVRRVLHGSVLFEVNFNAGAWRRYCEATHRRLRRLAWLMFLRLTPFGLVSGIAATWFFCYWNGIPFSRRILAVLLLVTLGFCWVAPLALLVAARTHRRWPDRRKPPRLIFRERSVFFASEYRANAVFAYRFAQAFRLVRDGDTLALTVRVPWWSAPTRRHYVLDATGEDERQIRERFAGVFADPSLEAGPEHVSLSRPARWSRESSGTDPGRHVSPGFGRRAAR